MIDFTPDSPFLDNPNPLFPSRVRLVGLGHTGVAVCDQVTMLGKFSQDVWALDTDQQTIEGSVVSQRKLLAADQIRGLGCAGDFEFARQVAEQEATHLEALTIGCDFLILTLGLAGATGAALAEKLIHLAREQGVRVMVLTIPPFTCEAPHRQDQALQTLAMLRAEADSVLVLPLEMLSESISLQQDLRRGFHLMHKILAETARALAQVVCKRGLIQLSFADVRSLFGRYADAATVENCWVAQTENNLQDSAEEMVEKLMEGPLLADTDFWAEVDHAMVIISGPRELGLSEVQEMVLALQKRLPVSIPISTSASLEEDNRGEIDLTLLLARTAPVQKPTIETKFHKPISPVLTKTSSGTLAIPSVDKNPKPKTEIPLKQVLPPPPIKPQPVAEPEVIAEFETGPLAVPAKSGRYLAKQEEMQFDSMTRGRFEHSQETIYRGENLDQPTFRRRRLAIRL